MISCTNEVVLERSQHYVDVAKNRSTTHFNTTDEIWIATKSMKGVRMFNGMWKINRAFLNQ